MVVHIRKHFSQLCCKHKIETTKKYKFVKFKKMMYRIPTYSFKLKYELLLLALVLSFSCFAKNKPTTVAVEARQNALAKEWKTYQAQTVDRIPGFIMKKEPKLNQYGSWMTEQRTATGFFRTEFINNRWWIIDPEGYPYYCKGVAVFRPGASDLQIQKKNETFGSDSVWAEKETSMLKSWGFNGLGAWSAVDLISQMETPMAYTIIISPMGNYKSEHIKKFGGKYKVADWQGYRFDLAMVFDPEFDVHVAKAINAVEKFKNDKFLLGYFTDNELPWKNDALDRHLNFLAKDEAGYIATKKWLDERKGKDASVNDITQEDRMAFMAFYFETYMRKVTEALRKADPNHMYLGCRFNQDREQELTNPEIFKLAGKYMDIISINHYRKWQPLQEQMKNWGEWSGKPFLITEWYTKGEDSGLPNNTGAGWNVRTQQDRGYFYENFTIELLKNKYSVGWHWFTYQDNDPLNLKTDSSNRDSNKGLVDSNYNPYNSLLQRTKDVNSNVWNLIRFFDNNTLK